MISELWSDLRYRIRALVRRQELERELDVELRFHLEHEAEKYERMGVPRSEALRRARLDFGGVEEMKERSRDARGTMLVDSTLQDARYALRGLRAKPGFTVGVVLTLGLGIGANAAMFGVVDRLLFRPPPYMRDADQVHRVYLAWTSNKSERVERSMQFPRYLDLMNAARSFSSMAAFNTWQAAVGDGDAARQRAVTAASASYFDFFDAHPALGRFFTAREDSIPVGSPVAVLGYAYWQSDFGGRPDALGQQLRVGHTLYTIIGVAPEGFTGMADQGLPALYVPIAAFAWDMRGSDYSKDYHWSWLEVVARPRPGTTVATATADLSAAHQRSWIAQDPDRGPQMVASSRPRVILGPVQLGRGPQAGPEAKVVVWVTGVAVIVLLVACANVANLLLARAITRRREIALRLALGVSRRRLMRQLLTESLVLAALGGMVGLIAAQWGGAMLAASFLPPDFSTSVLTDKRTVIVALAATMSAAILTGLAPAFHAVRSDLAQALNAGGRDSGARPSRTRTLLLIFQATLSVVLLIGAGLFVRSLHNVRSMRLGYDVDPVLVVTRSMRGVSLTDAQRMALEQRMVDEARATPGVVSATQAASVPFWSNEGRPLFVPGVDTVSKLGRFLLQSGNADYFKTLGTRIVRGRAFDASDRAGGPGVIVVSEGMTNALWPARDPLGKCVRIGADTAPCSTVIGVAENMRTRSLAEDREYAYYLPIAQYGAPTGMLFVRVTGDAAEHAEIVRRRLQRLMPGAAYVTTQPFRNMVDPTMQSWRFGATMFVAFGGLALALAGIGLYSMIAYGVAQRRQEIGIRIALGASRASVVRLVVRGGVRLVIVGVIAGGAISLWAGKWVASLLFREPPNDPAVYVGVAAVLIGVALVATAMPAIAAARVDPTVALRAD